GRPNSSTGKSMRVTCIVTLLCCGRNDHRLPTIDCRLICGLPRAQTGSARIAEMAEAGENSHSKNYLCKIRLHAENPDERQETCAAALPTTFKVMQLTAQIQGE